MLTSSVISCRHYFLCTKEISKNPRNRWKLMKIASIDREILQIFWMTWGISMKFSRKIWLVTILKVTRNQGFTLSLEDIFFQKTTGGGSNWNFANFVQTRKFFGFRPNSPNINRRKKAQGNSRIWNSWFAAINLLEFFYCFPILCYLEK